MLGRFDVALTREDYADGLAVVTQELGKRDPVRDRRIWEQLGAGTLLLIVLLFLFPGSDLAIVVTLLAEAFLLAMLGERWVRQSFGVSYDPATARFTVEFTDRGIAEQNPHRTREWQWAAVRQVHDNGDMLVIELDGWDMLILPSRLWPDAARKAAFLREARERVPPRPDATASSATTILEPKVRDQLQVGAIAAGVDVLFLIAFLIPQAGANISVPVVVTALLIGTALGYFAYRIARTALPRLYVLYPHVALIGTHVLIYAVPLYIVVAFLGWIEV